MDWLGWLTIVFAVVLLTGVGLFVLARVRWRQGGKAMAERIEKIRAEQQRLREQGGGPGATHRGAPGGPGYQQGGVVLPGEVVRPGGSDPDAPPSRGAAGPGSASTPAPWTGGAGSGPSRGDSEIIHLSVPGPVGRRAAGVAYGCLAGPLVGLGLLGLFVCALIAIFR